MENRSQNTKQLGIIAPVDTRQSSETALRNLLSEKDQCRSGGAQVMGHTKSPGRYGDSGNLDGALDFDMANQLVDNKKLCARCRAQTSLKGAMRMVEGLMYRKASPRD